MSTVLFRGAAILAAILAATTTLFFFKSERLDEMLTQTELRLAQARGELSRANATIQALERYSADLERAREAEREAESLITESNGANDALDPETLRYLRGIGLLAD